LAWPPWRPSRQGHAKKAGNIGFAGV